ncbi:LacI family transcriptional regulator [Promicromonospora sp. AC04]|uniref:LacI family DNA-binding transcriptional regulator n=1 Tax=Promicromonospora sp. AC04 TaxID=2135723 RepID=UPI000D424B90|nr:LacI family DNA-binding transcriptional regulator [Promicromonospora sp. AC04]PUB25265.1 LacI family transcriptional regulator [Promicromonospora sp. AC04]
MVGIRDVAEAAGVSVSTVSQVVTGRRPVAAATRARVEAAITRLGYRAHPGASQLRGGRTGTIALIVPTLENPFYPLVAVGMQDVLVPRNILLTVTDASGMDRSASAIHRLLSRRVDAMVAAPFGLPESSLAELHDAGIPFVSLGKAPPGGGDFVHTDDVSGAREVTTHLIERGRRRIAFLGGEESVVPTQQRLEGYQAALRAAGLPVRGDDVVFEEYTREGGRKGAATLLDRDDRPDAIVAANDLIALGVLDATRARGLRVPDDVAVTGYDDIEAASLVSPPLTTIENPAREIGRACARLLLERLDGMVTDVARTVALSTRLIVRDSS